MHEVHATMAVYMPMQCVYKNGVVHAGLLWNFNPQISQKQKPTCSLHFVRHKGLFWKRFFII